MNTHRLLPAILCAAVIYLLAVPVEIMDVDAAQYASMGREMLENRDFLNVFDRGKDYLDKPPFIFWVTALSYATFGINNFAFKFPAILFALLGIWSVFRFTKLWYNRETAIIAAAVLATSQGYFHFTNDVRTDVYLTNAVIASIWMLSEHLKSPKSFWWIPAFFFIGIGMLAKGPIGMMAPALAFGTHIVFKNEWKTLLNWRLYAGLIIVGFVLTPMLLSLYYQFDAEPQKWVNGRQGVSGLRFFFWEQSFGRLTGENVWKNDTSPFFFVHSLAWSFLPWSILFFAAFFKIIKSFFTDGIKALNCRSEWISFGGFLLPFIALSASKYKLPHYIYVVFPLAAVITADYLFKLYTHSLKKETAILKGFQVFILFGAWAFAGIIFLWFFPLDSIFLWFIGIIGIAVFLMILFNTKQSSWHKIMYMSFATAFSINVLLALHFYPEVLNYQAGGKVGAFITEQKIPKEKVFNLNAGSRALDVYAQTIVKSITPEEIDSLVQKESTVFLFTDEKGKSQIEQDYESEILLSLDNFSVSLLRMNFGNPQKRPETLQPRYFIKVIE